MGFVSAEGNLRRLIAVRLKPGTDLYQGLLDACKKHEIKNGVIITALGSLEGAKYCNPVEMPDKKIGFGYGEPTYLEGPIELTGTAGIVCNDANGEINLHVHISLSDEQGHAHGGHLLEGTKVLITVEAVIGEIGGILMDRGYNEDMELTLFEPRRA